MTSRWWLPALDGPPPAAAPRRAYEIVVVGCSLGGLQALEVILDGMPRNFPLPIAVVQHRHQASNETLPSHLRRFSRLPVVDVEDKQWIRPGTVYLAPANYRSEEHTSELQSRFDLVCRLLLEKKKIKNLANI